MNFGYVIMGFANGSNVPKFVAIDHLSGGYPYWSDSVTSAKVFNAPSEAHKMLNSSDFVNENEMTDGKVFPPRMIHSGADINYAQPQGTLNVVVAPLTIGTPDYERVYHAEIKRGRAHDRTGWQPK